MLTNFKELEDYVLSRNMKKRIALANAHDEPALSAVVHAHRKGVVDGTLVGKKNEIIAMLHDMGENESDYEIVDFDGEELEAAKIAVQLVREGKADIPMKGILQTSNFARAILNKETGLIPKGGRRLVSQCGIFEYEGRFIMITDAAINIAPDVETQIGIVENALPVARALGVECPKVAVLSAVENVTDKMPSTVTAREIAERGVEGCVISGPLALDGAISMESVKHKAIKDPVAGQADILLVPFIEIGNVLYKACSYIAGKTMASTICGASCPVIITSRADTPDSKYYSILMAVLRCLKAEHMATSADYLTFVLEQLPPLGVVRSRKMFGEYMAYLHEKPVLLVCDNTVFVKKLPEVRELLAQADCGAPYPGAKEHYILDIENRDLLHAVIPVLEAATPVPAPRKKKEKNHD